jgi:hypothetical protein
MKKIIFGLIVIFFLSIGFSLTNFVSIAQATSGSGIFTQNDWSGGDGQAIWSDVTKYDSTGGDGIYAGQNLRMKINADTVVGQEDMGKISPNGADPENNTLWNERDVFYDGNKFFVADSGNHRVLIYNSIPTTNGVAADVVIGQTDFTTNASGTSSTKLNYPMGVYSDGTRLFVADYNNNRVLIYNSIPTTNGVAADEAIGQTDFTSTLVELYCQNIFLNSQYLIVTDDVGNRVLLYLKATASSTLTSSVYSVNQSKDWGPISWDADNSIYSGVKVEIKTDQSQDWSEVQNNQEFIGRGKSIQYRVTLFNVDGLSSPTFNEISISYQDATNRNLNDIRLSYTNAKQQLDDDQKTYSREKKNNFQGQDSRLVNGQIKIYKNGKRIKTIEADSDGKWKGSVNIDNKKTCTLEFKFYDQYAVIIYSKKYEIQVDTTKPIFTSPFSQILTISKNQPIIFTATDAITRVDYYKIKFLDREGHILRSWKKQKSDSYIIPEKIINQASTVLVRAYDKAGNYEEETASVQFGKTNTKGAISKVTPSQSTLQSTPSSETLPAQNNVTTSEGYVSQEVTQSQSIPQTQAQPQTQTQTKTSHWWNPFSWF